MNYIQEKEILNFQIKLRLLYKERHISECLKRAFFHIFWILYSYISFNKEKDYFKLHNKNWIFCVSQNNYEALKFLIQKDDFIVVSLGYMLKQTNFTYTFIPYFKKYKFLFKRLFYIVRDNGFKSFTNIDLIIHILGNVDSIECILKFYNPKSIIFSNDHNINSRSALFAAKNLNIKTIYLQHAVVSEIFPPLIFDLALLEGNDTLDKYVKIGGQTSKVFLIGMPKFDSFCEKAKRKQRTATIGVGINMLDDLSVVISCINFLRNQFDDNYAIVVRPHPRMIIDDLRLPAFISTSNPSKENSFEFLQRIDILIAGNSSIHLEAVLSNVLSIYYEFGNSVLHDYYGFCKNGLCYSATDFYSISDKIRDYTLDLFLYLKAKYYNAVLGTEYEGRSEHLAKEKIHCFLDMSK
jgi:hypothetical protein